MKKDVAHTKQAIRKVVENLMFSLVSPNVFMPAALLLILPAVMMNAQELTPEECCQQAQAHYPLIKRYGLIEKTKDYTISNADKRYLPQFSLSAKAGYQSDVTELPVDLPGIDIRGMRKDQYQAVLQLDQTVWDGGAIRAQKEIARTTAEADKQKLNVDMYTVNQRVNRLFFGILLLEGQLKQNCAMQEELERSYNNVNAYMKNGIANQADLDAVKVEQLNNIRQRQALETSHRAYCEMLRIMIHRPTPLTSGMLKKPEVHTLLYIGETYPPSLIRRPELNQFAAQKQRLEACRKQLMTKMLPNLGVFLQGAYGNPGLNMLKNKFSAYYTAGIRLSWNFGNLYTHRNESRQLTLDGQEVDVQKETFLFNTRLEITPIHCEIKKLTEWMKNDDEIITLRSNIKKSALAKVANGTLTVTEMLREVTAENLAKQDKILHEIQLLSVIYELKYLTNQYEDQ